jgi:Xaa-Pro aminopeptidase
MDDITRSLRRINPDDINPRFNCRHLPALGTMGVDFEQRVD